MKLSKTTLFLGVCIVISAAFMLQVSSWLSGVFGNTAVTNSFRRCIVLIFILTAWRAFKIGTSPIRFCAIILVFIMAYLFAARQPYFAERMHVLTYGLLAYLASKDLIDGKEALVKDIILTVSFVALVSAIDETFQYFLPYRVGELRDAVTNIVSGVFGMGLFFALN